MSSCSSAPRVDAARGCGPCRGRCGRRRWRRAPRSATPPPAGSASTSSRPSSPSRRRALATARSSPATTRSRASAWASSWRRSAGVSATLADDRSPKPRVPSSWRTTRSRSIRWWAMPATCRRRRSRHSVSRASSVRSAAPVASVASVASAAAAPADRAARSRSRGRPSWPDDDEGVALPGAPRRHDAWHTHAGPLGEQRHEPLVLDQLDPRQPGRALAAPVPRQAPQRRQQLGVPGVAAVDLDVSGPSASWPVKWTTPPS